MKEGAEEIGIPDTEQISINSSDSTGKRNNFLDYDPTHFLRCHSKKNDSADVQTQVRFLYRYIYLITFSILINY